MSIFKNISRTKTTSPFIVIGLVVSFFLFTSFVDGKGKVIENFEKAIQNEDVTYLMSNVISEDQGLLINEENMKMLIHFLKEENRIESYVENLNDSGKSDFLSLKKSATALFNSYKIVIHPYHLQLYFQEGLRKITLSNGTEYEVNVGGQEIANIPVIPGDYEATAHYETRFLSYDTSFSFELATGNITNEKQFVHHLKLGAVTILAQWQDVEFYINGSKVHEGIDLPLQPIPVDGSYSFYLKKKYPWGTFTSEEVTIEASKTYLEGRDFPKIRAVNEPLKNQIVSTMEKFLLNWQTTIAENNIELLENVTDNFIPIAGVYLRSFERLNRELIKFTIDQDSITIYEDMKGNYIANVIVHERLQDEENIIYYDHRGYFLIYDSTMNTWILDVMEEAILYN